MSRVDIWNQRYSEQNNQLTALPVYIKQKLSQLPVGRTLDLACGEGSASVYLASMQHDVIAVDFAAEGLKRLQRFATGSKVEITTLKKDLESPEALNGLGCFDNIVILRFLPNQELLERLPALMKPGARLLIITFNVEHHRRTGFPERFCLKPAELKDKLTGLTMIEYDNGPTEGALFDSYLFESESSQ